jgi:phosphoglycolate phosphatase-like HAD superfamily hydrolase
MARGQFGTEGEAVFMIGDSVSDIQAARKAGVKSIAVGWGHQSLSKLVAARPDAIVRLPGELIETVDLIM